MFRDMFYTLTAMVVAQNVFAQSPSTAPTPSTPQSPTVRPADSQRPPAAVAPTTPQSPTTSSGTSQGSDAANSQGMAPNNQFQNQQQNQDQQAPVLSSAPRMIGDFPGSFATGCVTVRSFISGTITIQTGNPADPKITVRQLPNFAEVTERHCFEQLIFGRGAFKIAENESPQPQDRIYLTYNYFSNIPAGVFQSTGQLRLQPGGAFSGINGTGPFVLRDTLAATIGVAGTTGAPATLTDVTPSNVNLHREVIGFEKTFANGNASAGLRLPIFQADQTITTGVNGARLAGFTTFPNSANIVEVSNGIDRARVGDLSIVLKYAFINDADRVISGGLVVTTPTGGSVMLLDGSTMSSTLLQPYIGWLRNWDRVYTHGFLSFAFPTDSRDITFMFNDLGVGYFIFRDGEGVIRSVAPTVEAHLSTPLNSKNNLGLFASDVLVFTGGINFGLGQRTTLTLGVATPVTGPRPDQIEAAVQLNWTF